MKLFLSTIAFVISCSFANAQMVAKVEIKEPVQGLCNYKEVYSLFPMFGDQQEAVCPVTDEEILRRLDSAVIFLKENPKFKGDGMVSILLNCKGEVVKCQIDNKTKDPTLDSQVVAVFNALGEWKPGKLNGKPVDSMRLYSFKVNKGKISIE